MEAQLIEPFYNAVTSVLPMIGFQEIKKGRMSAGDKVLSSKGVTIIIGVTKGLKGSIAYNMNLDSAFKIASKVMCGMTVEELNELSQSALSEMVNMMTANSAICLEKMGTLIDISPPNFITGESFKVSLTEGKFICLEILADGIPLEMNINVERK